MEPLVRIAAQRASQHVLELTRNVTSRGVERRHVVRRLASENLLRCLAAERRTAEQCEVDRGRERIDRKSTRLNSSHGYISYAVFCLKKKKNRRQAMRI